MAAYRRVDDLWPALWLFVHREQLRAQRSVTSTGSLFLLQLKVERFENAAEVSLPASDEDGCWICSGLKDIVLMLSEHRMDSLSINVGSSVDFSLVVRMTHMWHRFTWMTRRFDRFSGDPCNVNIIAINEWSDNFYERPHRRGGFFTENNVMWHRPVKSIAVGCSSRAVMPLLRTERFIIMHTPQTPYAFLGPDNPQNCPLSCGIWTPI